MITKQIKVMVVDDSPTAQQLMRYVIESDPELSVIDVSSNGMEALLKLETIRPDVITVDIAMPKMDGFELTRKIMEKNPIPIIIVSSNYTPNEIDKSFKAMEAGALAIIEKPRGMKDSRYPLMAKQLIQSLKVMSGVKVVTRQSNHHAFEQTQQKPIEANVKSSTDYHAVAIGGSLGGPQALHTLLPKLPVNFGAPIYIVQHISPGFLPGMVSWLQNSCALQIRIPREGERGYAGCIYIAPDHHQMIVQKGNLISLKKDKHDPQKQPSVDNLFESVGETFHQNAIGVILTGMGKDGAEGLLYMRSKGAFTIAQNEESCVMFGMPKEAIRLGAAKKVISLTEIAEEITTLVSAKSTVKLQKVIV